MTEEMRTWIIFNKRIITLLLVLVLIVTSLTPGIMIGASVESEPGTPDEQGATRARADKIINGTKIYKSSGNTQFDNVIVKDNGTLIIKGSTLTVKQTLFVKDNGTVLIEELGLLNVNKIYANCKRFELNGGRVQDANEIIIHTRDPIIINDQAWIKVQGTLGSVNVDGDDGVIELISNSYIKIMDKVILDCKGGDGVVGDENTRKGSGGGDGIINIQANNTDSNNTSVLISKSTLNALGGRGGSGYLYGDGGDGGSGLIKIVSKASSSNEDKIDIDRCTKIAANGNSGGIGNGDNTFDGIFGDAQINFECNKLLVDNYKADDEQYWTPGAESTTLIASTITPNIPTINIKTKNDAFLYFPYVQGYTATQDYTILKAGNAQTNIYVYNVLKLKVVDNLDTGLPNADITLYRSSQEVATGKSNDGGIDVFLLEGYKIDTKNTKKSPTYYSAKAVYQTAPGENPSFVVDDRVVEVEVNITLVEVFITHVEFGGKKYTAVSGMEVAGLIKLYGTATTSGGRIIDNVKLDIYKNNDLTISGDTTDSSSNSDPYSTWTFEVDARDSKIFKDNDELRVEGLATDDGGFSNLNIFYMIVKNDIIPRPPVVVILNPKNQDTVDDEKTSAVTISGTAFDPDRDSNTQIASKDIVELSLIIKNSTGVEVFTEKLDKDDLKYLVDNKSYEWNYKWESRDVNKNTEYFFPEGEYSIYVTVKDKTNLISEESTRSFTLKHGGKRPSDPPTAVIKSITATQNADKINFVYDAGTETAIYTFQGTKGEHEVKLKFDLSGSYDNDGDKNDPEYLKYFAEVDTKASTGKWETEPMIEREFFESEWGMKYYRMVVRVQDKWGWNNVNLQVYNEKTGANVDVENLTIKIEYREVDPPQKGILSFIFGDSLDLSLQIVHIIFIVLIIVFNLAAGMMIISKFKKINKRRKAREFALDSAKQKQVEVDKKSKEDIYSHIQYVDESGGGTGRVEVAGASALTEMQQQDMRLDSVEDLARPAEPEAPKLVSMTGPVYESAGADYDLSPPEVTPVPVQTQPQAQAPAQAQVQVQVQPIQQAQPIQPTAATSTATPTPTPTTMTPIVQPAKVAQPTPAAQVQPQQELVTEASVPAQAQPAQPQAQVQKNQQNSEEQE